MRRKLGWGLLFLSLVGWPVSAFTFASGEPVTVLALSWIAITIGALDVLFTAQVKEDNGGEQSSPSVGDHTPRIVIVLHMPACPCGGSGRERGTDLAPPDQGSGGL